MQDTLEKSETVTVVKENASGTDEQKIFNFAPHTKHLKRTKKKRKVKAWEQRVIALQKPNWADIDPWLGRVSDKAAANFFKVSIQDIQKRRDELSILPLGIYPWDMMDPLFKYGSDEEIYEMLQGNVVLLLLQYRREHLASLQQS